MVEDLKARARSARRHLDAYEREMKEIDLLLPIVRVQSKGELGPRKLEEMILGLYDRGTISRKTAEAAGTSRKSAAATDA